MSTTTATRDPAAARGPGSTDEFADEHELIAAAQKGDGRALERIVGQHTPLVRRIARRFHSQQSQEELDDLTQTGSVALVEAVGRFKPERGQFASYAAVCIAGAIKRHFRDRSWRMRIPRPLHDAALRVRQISRAHEAEHGAPPSAEHLFELTGIDPALIREAQAMLDASWGRSLQEQVGDGTASLEETVGASDSGYGRAETRMTVDRLTAGLPARERKLLAMRFGLESTQLEIAGEIGISQMQVSRLLRGLLEEMGQQEMQEMELA